MERPRIVPAVRLILKTVKTANSPLHNKYLAALFVFECVFLLVLAEALIAWTGLDMRLLEKLLYYQCADVELHRASGNAALHYELKPGASAVFAGNRKVAVNSLGFRDPPRAEAKPAGVKRIVCLGSSNTYGALVDNGQTYPARLERLLNGPGPGRYEVWNAGVSAYTLPQNVAAAREVLAKYSPDLLLFQFNNCGRRPFLAGQPVRTYFDRDPELYFENLRFCWPRGLAFLRHWRLFRALVFAVNRLSLPAEYSFLNMTGDGYDWRKCSALRAGDNRLFREFYEENRGKVRMAVVTAPGGAADAEIAALGLPVIELSKRLPPGHAAEFDKIHPPAYVYGWYAREILKSLTQYGLLPVR